MGEFLKNVTTGKRDKPFRVLLYGRHGVGKTTWSSQSPKPIFLGQHGESDELDVPRLPKVESWYDALAAIDELQTEKHDYQTFIVDTIDWLEPLVWKAVCNRGLFGKPVHHIEEFGYGKGYLAAVDEWRLLLSKLEELEDRRGMNTVILAHSQVKTFQNPEGDPYDRFELKLDKRAAALIMEWTKAVLFATFEVYTKKDQKGDRKAKAFGEGARIVHTQPRPAWDAKSRYPLPATMALAWDDFAAAARGKQVAPPDDLRQQVEKLLVEVDALTREQGSAALGRCGDDQAKLGKLVEWLRGRVVAAAE